MHIHTLRLDQHGLERLFGALEVKIMEATWALREAKVQDVVERLGKGAHYKTVMTVMNRLVAKGFLKRRKVSRAFIYVPLLTREELIAQLSRQVLDGLLADFGSAMLAQFVDVIEENDHAYLVDLAGLVETKLAQQQKRE